MGNYVRVDLEDKGSKVEGYSYENKDGSKEYVRICTARTSIQIIDAGYGASTIYHEDIPKLIKALEAAYNHKD